MLVAPLLVPLRHHPLPAPEFLVTGSPGRSCRSLAGDIYSGERLPEARTEHHLLWPHDLPGRRPRHRSTYRTGTEFCYALHSGTPHCGTGDRRTDDTTLHDGSHNG